MFGSILNTSTLLKTAGTLKLQLGLLMLDKSLVHRLHAQILYVEHTKSANSAVKIHLDITLWWSGASPINYSMLKLVSHPLVVVCTETDC